MTTLTMPEQTEATIPTSPQSIKTMSPPSSPPSTTTTKALMPQQNIERRSDSAAVSDNSSAASAQLISSSQQQKREGPPSSSNNNSTTLNTTSTTSNNTPPTSTVCNKQQQQQQQQSVETTKSNSSSEVKKRQQSSSSKQKQLTKAQNYVLASKLAQAQQLQQQQQQQTPSRHTRSKSQVGREGQPLQQTTTTNITKPRKQRIITPQMIARRPIETKGTMMRSSHPPPTKTSSHSKTSCGDSIAESVETDITEQITNNKQSIAKRRKEEKMLKKKYVPTLDKVDTFDNKLDNNDVENGGDVTNTNNGSVNSSKGGDSNSSSKGGERKFMKSLFAKKKAAAEQQKKKENDKRFDNAVTAAAKLAKETNTNNKKKPENQKLVSKKSSLVTVADYPLDTTDKKKDAAAAESTDDTSGNNNGDTEDVEEDGDINNMESKDSLKTEGSFTLLDTKSPGVQHPTGLTTSSSPVNDNKKEADEIVLPENKSEEKKMEKESTTTEGRKEDKEEVVQEKKKDIKPTRSPRSSPRSVSSKKSNKSTASSSAKAKKKKDGPSTTRATTTTTTNIDAKIEQSNSRVGSLKKELLLLARPGMDDDEQKGKGVIETYSQIEKDSEVDSRWAPGSVTSNSSSISSKGSMQIKKKTVEATTPNTATVSKKKKTKVKKNKRLGNNKKKSFLGKKSKVIEEESEYVSYGEEERDDVAADVNQDEEEEDINDIYEREGPSQSNRRQRPPASPVTERATTGRQTATKKKQPNHHVEEEEESAESISMKSTLSDADFFSVESPITTDSEAFNYKPGVFKRTASLVKNPALTLRHRATTTRDGKADELLMKRMKHGRHVARVDNRKKERAHRLPPPAKIQKQKNQQKEKKDDDTDIKSEEMDQVQQLLDQDDTIEIEKVVVQDDTLEETDKDEVVVDNEIIEVDDGIAIDDKAHDVACGANSLIEENDVMLEPTGTFEAIEFEEHQYQVRFQASGISVDSSTQRRMNEHLNPTPKAPPSVIRTVSSAGMISAAPSKEIATQTSTDQYVDHVDVNPVVTLTESNVGSTRRNVTTANTSSSEVGSFSHMMESMGLFGAQVCLGSSKFMVNCADSCSDNPKGPKKAAERLVSIDSDVVDRLSPRSAEPRGCGIMVSDKDPEQEAAGIFTRALAIALKSHCQSDGGGGGLDESARVMPKYHHEVDEYEEEEEDQVSLPQQRNHRHAKKHRHKLDSSNTIYAESIDGRFVPMNQHKRKKRVPRNIAVKPKTKKQTTHHRSQEMLQQHHEEDSEESSAPQDQGRGYEETIELTRTTSSKGKKKGIKGFLNKLSKVRLGLLYEV